MIPIVALLVAVLHCMAVFTSASYDTSRSFGQDHHLETRNAKQNPVDSRILVTHTLSSTQLDVLYSTTDVYGRIAESSQNWTNILGYDEWTVILGSKGGLQNSLQCFVMFRGSNEMEDFIGLTGNADYWLRYVYMPGSDQLLGVAHHGFADAYDQIQPFVEQEIIEKCGGDIETVTFAGFSRGGALATLAATSHYLSTDFDSKSNTQTQLVTWGSPRVLDEVYADFYLNRFMQIRVVNQNDGVTSVPPSSTVISPLPFMGYVSARYSHLGSPVCLECNAKLPDDSEDGNTLAAHDWLQYQKRINEFRAEQPSQQSPNSASTISSSRAVHASVFSLSLGCTVVALLACIVQNNWVL
eukprot:CFRG3847T1